MSNGWEPASTAPDGVPVIAAVIDEKVIKREQRLVRKGRLWFVDSDLSTYNYWTPTHWRPDNGSEQRA